MQTDINLKEVQDIQGAKIAAVGIGGGGSNMIAHLINNGVHDAIKLFAANTDIQHLSNCPAPHKIKLGEKLTKGLGAGMIPERGRESAEESYDIIRESLEGLDIVFVSAGLGGGTGTGAAPVVAKAAQEVGALTIAVVTKPFRMEGNKRSRIAEEGLRELRKHCDGIIVIPNEKLLTIIKPDTGLKESFQEVDAILARAVNGISNVILKYGDNDINTDFADLKTVMSNKGLALMGIGEFQGDNAATEAVKKAIDSPLFDNLSINGAKGILLSFEINPGYPLYQISQAMDLIHEVADEDAHIIFGTYTSEDIPKDLVRLTIVATGFEKEVINNAEQPSQKTKDNKIFQNIHLVKISGGENFEMEDLDKPTWARKRQD